METIFLIKEIKNEIRKNFSKIKKVLFVKINEKDWLELYVLYKKLKGIVKKEIKTKEEIKFFEIGRLVGQLEVLLYLLSNKQTRITYWFNNNSN